MTGRPDDAMLMACTGLEGGVVASGSTCGVVTGGVLSLACAAEHSLLNGAPGARSAVIERAQGFVRWFEQTYGSCLCRERTGVDFYTPSGQLRYLVPGDKVARCLWHMRGAMRYLYHHRKPEDETAGFTIEPAAPCSSSRGQCGLAVLEGVRNETGVGNIRLERAAFVLDGGVALSGGVCGALAGAIMAVNMVLGLQVRRMSYGGRVASFVRGHANLLRRADTVAPEPFGVGRKVLKAFKNIAGETECRAITGRTFSGEGEFQAHMADAASPCRNLIQAMIGQASAVVRPFS